MPLIRPTGDRFWLVQVEVVLALIGALGVVFVLVLLLTPVSAHIVDAPCGSVLVPTKVHYSDAGVLVFANTPSCYEVRMARLPVGVVGLSVLVVPLVSGRRRDTPRLCPGLRRWHPGPAIDRWYACRVHDPFLWSSAPPWRRPAVGSTERGTTNHARRPLARRRRPGSGPDRSQPPPHWDHR